MRVECKQWYTLFFPSVLSEYSSLSRKSLSVWVTRCCVSWQQWCLHTDVQYGGSIAPMREKKGICNLKRKHSLPEWSTFLSYLLCILKKEACQHAYLPTTIAPSSAQCLNLYVLFCFASFLVCSWTHQFSELLNLWAMSYICVLNENLRPLRCYSLTECSTTPAFHRFIG